MEIVAIILAIPAGDDGGRHLERPADKLQAAARGGRGVGVGRGAAARRLDHARAGPADALADEDECGVGDAVQLGDGLDRCSPPSCESAEGVAGFDRVTGHAVSGRRRPPPRTGHFARDHDFPAHLDEARVGDEAAVRGAHQVKWDAVGIANAAQRIARLDHVDGGGREFSWHGHPSAGKD